MGNLKEEYTLNRYKCFCLGHSRESMEERDGDGCNIQRSSSWACWKQKYLHSIIAEMALSLGQIPVASPPPCLLQSLMLPPDWWCSLWIFESADHSALPCLLSAGVSDSFRQSVEPLGSVGLHGHAADTRSSSPSQPADSSYSLIGLVSHFVWFSGGCLPPVSTRLGPLCLLPPSISVILISTQLVSLLLSHFSRKCVQMGQIPGSGVSSSLSQ